MHDRPPHAGDVDLPAISAGRPSEATPPARGDPSAVRNTWAACRMSGRGASGDGPSGPAELTVADNLSAVERSRCMSRVRSRHMRPERIVRSIVHRMGYRFRLHRRDLPGTPDLVLPRRRAVIFVNGCFWHWHPGPRAVRLAGLDDMGVRAGGPRPGHDPCVRIPGPIAVGTPTKLRRVLSRKGVKPGPLCGRNRGGNHRATGQPRETAEDCCVRMPAGPSRSRPEGSRTCPAGRGCWRGPPDIAETWRLPYSIAS